jgi:hypothetical protein
VKGLLVDCESCGGVFSKCVRLSDERCVTKESLRKFLPNMREAFGLYEPIDPWYASKKPVRLNGFFFGGLGDKDASGAKRDPKEVYSRILTWSPDG